MLIKNFKHYIIVADSWDSGGRWGHVASLVIGNNYTVEEVKIRYYNRTWEVYQFQSVMKKVIDKRIDSESASAIKSYKELNNIQRISKKVKNNIIEDSGRVQELIKIYKTL